MSELVNQWDPSHFVAQKLKFRHKEHSQAVQLVNAVNVTISISADVQNIHHSPAHKLYMYRVGQKKWGHSTFSRISSNTFSRISSKLQKIILRFFLHTSRPVYTEHAYNMSSHSLYNLKRRQLVNRFPFDNTTLKLQHHNVGQRFAHKKDKSCVCATRGQGNSQY